MIPNTVLIAALAALPMIPITVLLAALGAAAADKDAKPPAPAARAVITAELACLHCTFGEGDGCAVCLKLDDKTPVLLDGKAAKAFHEMRLDRKVLVAEGTLTLNKDKRFVLTSDDAHLHDDKDKGKAPEKGQVRVVGQAGCAHCDLKLLNQCTAAVLNADFPIVLDGKLAAQHAEAGKEALTITAVGKLFIDKSGLLRLDATQLNLEKTKR